MPDVDDSGAAARPLSAPWAASAAVVGGLATSAVFPPLDLPIALLLGVWGLQAATRGQRLRRASWIGALFGLGFMLPLLRWNMIVGVDGWLVVCLLETAFLWLLGPLWSIAQRVWWWPVPAAAAWVAVETLRSHLPFGGFPWGKVAFGTVGTPLDDLGRLGGSELVAFGCVLSAGCLVAAATAAVRRRLVPAVSLLLATVAPPLVGVLVPTDAAGPTGRSLQTAVVQGGVPGDGMDPFAERRAVLDNHANATHQLAAQVREGSVPRPDLVVWPENSTDIDPYEDPSAYAEIDSAVRDIGVPVLVGAVVDTPDPMRVKNMGIVWSPRSGPGQTYVKRHPVPFGEYLPFRDILSKYIERFRHVSRDFQHGQRVGSLSIDGTTVGDLICFEVAYDGLTRDLIDHGAQMIMVQTNNATWARQYPFQLEQQFEMSRYRAVETGRYVVVASTNGISGIVAPDGSVLERTSADTSAVLHHDVPLASGTTWGVRLGSWVEWLITIGSLAGTALLARRTRPRPQEDE